MATDEEVTQLRRIASYEDTAPYDDVKLSEMIDATSINAVASRLWNEKAASLALLVNVAESGSSRSLGDAYKNAMAMSKYFTGLDVAVPVDTSRFARTRAIVRESA